MTPHPDILDRLHAAKPPDATRPATTNCGRTSPPLPTIPGSTANHRRPRASGTR